MDKTLCKWWHCATDHTAAAYQAVVNFVQAHPFTSGLILGAAAILFLLFLIWLFRPKSLKRITFGKTNGEVTITLSAIASVIRTLEDEIPVFEIGKVALFGKKDKKRLRLHVDFLYSKDVKLDEAVQQLQERSLSVLKDAMGISDIIRVEIVVRKTFVLGELPEDIEEKAAEPEKKPEVTEPAE